VASFIFLQSRQPLIAEILVSDAKAPKKQRHTAQRIFDRVGRGAFFSAIPRTSPRLTAG
jgi:hypothetical protein